MKLYHYTLRENVVDIITDKKLKSYICNNTYICPTIEDCIKFATMYSRICKRDINDYVVFEISELDIEEDKLTVSTDHNPLYFGGANALVYEGDIKFDEFEVYNIE